MTQVTKLFELGQLSEASYANLVSNMTPSALIIQLQNAGFNDMKFSATQAAEFADNWQVATHQADTASGYSGTLFRYIGNDPNSGFANGQYVYAIRGTAGETDLVGADGGDIVLDGLALDQIVDMYNDWKRINTAAGQHYQAAVLAVNNALGQELLDSTLAWNAYKANPFAVPLPSVLTPEQLLASYKTRSDIVIDLPSKTIRSIIFQDSGIAFSDNRAVGARPAGFTGQVTDVTGHSLGGHLSAAFTRLFGSEALTINGAGFGGGGIAGIGTNATFNITNLFAMLGGSSQFESSSIHNIYGDKMWELITQNGPGLYQKGSHDALFIEQSIPWSNTAGHGSSQMVDSLAIANLFIKLDASFSTKTPAQALATLNALMEKGSNQVAQSLENLVIGLSETILGTKPTISTVVREDLYAAIKALTDSATFQALIGKVTLVAPPTSASEARSDFGAFLSLYYLTPFAVNTLSANSKGILKGIHTELAAQWVADNLLTPNEIESGEQHFTDMWLKDRADFLKWKLEYNKKDMSYSEQLNTDEEGNWDYTDYSIKVDGSAITLAIDGAGVSFSDQQIIFGSKDNDNFNGSGDIDHLYGMAGNDTVNGGNGDDVLYGDNYDLNDAGVDEGADVLWGGEGRDYLIGSGGNDTLYGENGNDLLFGEEGNDMLYGGAGYDIYYFYGIKCLSFEITTDTIWDSDGQGQIKFSTQFDRFNPSVYITLAGTSSNASSGTWQDVYGVRYTWNGSSGADLTIRDGQNTTVIFKNFSNNMLGITLSSGSFANNVTGTNADDYLWGNAINDKAWKQAA